MSAQSNRSSSELWQRGSELARLFLGIFAIGTNLFIVVPLLPAIRQDFPHENISDIGQFLVSAYALPYALLAPALGPASDRLGRRPIIAAGLALLGLSAVAAAFAPTLFMLGLARAAGGIGASLFTPATYAFIGDRYAYAGREKAMAIVLAGLPMATVVGVPIGGLLAAYGTWRLGLGSVAAVAAVAFVFVLRLRPAPAVEQSRYWPLIAAALRDRAAMTAVTVSFLWFVAGLGLFTYMGQYLFTLFGLGPRSRAFAVGAYGVLGLVGSWAGVRFAAARGKRAAVLVGLTGLVAVFLSVALNRTSGAIGLFTLAAWGAASWFGMPALQAIISELRPLARGTLLSLNNSAMYLGATLGAAVMGKALEVSGFTGAGILAAAVMGAAVLTTALGIREAERATVETAVSRSIR